MRTYIQNLGLVYIIWDPLHFFLAEVGVHYTRTLDPRLVYECNLVIKMQTTSIYSLLMSYYERERERELEAYNCVMWQMVPLL